MLDNVSLGLVTSKFLRFPYKFSFHRLLRSHYQPVIRCSVVTWQPIKKERSLLSHWSLSFSRCNRALNIWLLLGPVLRTFQQIHSTVINFLDNTEPSNYVMHHYFFVFLYWTLHVSVNWASSGVQVVMVKDSAAHCNAVSFSSSCNCLWLFSLWRLPSAVLGLHVVAFL
jgi:hypothetical protein